MEKVVEELLHIEQMADAVLDDLAKSKGTLTKRINDEITCRIADIDRSAAHTIDMLRKDAEAEANAKIKQITKDAQHGASLVETAFKNHRDKWRAALFHTILQQQ